jgi:DNA-binding MarR family transcriptional regulator
MSSVSRPTADDRRRWRRLTVAVKEALRALSTQMSLLNHAVGTKLELRDVDFDCLDVLSRFGPLSPGALARRAGLHPATMTGILDRLERAGWVERERDPADRRAVRVRALPDRAGEIVRLYGGMSDALDELLAGYTDDQLEVIADFLRKAAVAGHGSTEHLI